MKKILAVILTFVMVLCCFSACGEDEGLAWEYLSHANVLPEPESGKIEVHDNDDGMWLTIDKMSINDYYEYKKICKNEYGFTVDMEDDGDFFEGFNQDGYFLDLYYNESQEELSVDLKAPMQMGIYDLPEYAVQEGLPVPKSQKGRYEWNDAEGFDLFVGDTTIDDYNKYKAECSAAGFAVDYDSGDLYYTAENENGYMLYLTFEGFNRMRIEFACPEDMDSEIEDSEIIEDKDVTEIPEIEETEGVAEAPEMKETEEVTEAPTEEEKDDLVGGIRPEFKEAMDSYEEFFEEYCEFMEKYADDPMDLSLLADYAKFMEQYAEIMEAMEAWDDGDMNADETAYYLDVMGRINKMLTEIAM